MTNDLAKNSLFFDYLYSLRVLEPGVRNETGELNDECISYTESKLENLLVSLSFLEKCDIPMEVYICNLELQGFRKIIDEFIGIAGRIVGDVKQEKNWAIAAQNQLKSITKQRDAVEQEIQVWQAVFN